MRSKLTTGAVGLTMLGGATLYAATPATMPADLSTPSTAPAPKITPVVIPGTAAPATGTVKQTVSEEKESINQRLSNIIDTAAIDNIPAKRVFEWWSKNSGVPLLLDWDKMAKDGIDPEQPIKIDLHRVPAGALLSAMMKQISGDDDKQLLYQLTPWYVQIQTKAEANRHPVIRIYDVRDLLHEVPNFSTLPDFDLNTTLGNQNGGGGGGGGSGSSGQTRGVFGSSGTTSTTAAAPPPAANATQGGEALAELIRSTIEPKIWIEHGGEKSSIKFFNGHLIVNAPLYVHAQIGIANRSPDDEPGSTAPASSSTFGIVRGTASGATVAPPRPGEQPRTNGVAAVARPRTAQ